MTERHAGYVVALERTLSAEDAARILDAIGQLRGVASVSPIAGDLLAEHVGAQRAHTNLSARILDVLEDSRPMT
jgi:hypothetical protein